MDNQALPVSDMINQDFDEYKDENIDSYLMYFSSNDNIEKVDLNDCVEHSNTVVPFIQQTHQKYFDNGKVFFFLLNFYFKKFLDKKEIGHVFAGL
jgi:hypothetical protein